MKNEIKYTDDGIAPMNLKVGLAEMLKGGVIMDVVNVEQAKIAEQSGAVAIMALERVPSDIRAQGGVARMSCPNLVIDIVKSVSIPVMAKCRIGHFVEAQILQEIGVDYIDESEVLTPADDSHHIAKHKFSVPFVCGATNLGEALRRIGEGAALIRTKGEPGTGNIIEAVRHLRQIHQDIKRVFSLDDSELMTEAKRLGAPYELLRYMKQHQKFPVPNFAAGGISTPADAALAMQLGAESVFVGSGIFKAESPEKFAKAIVKATARFNDPAEVLAASKGLDAPMRGLEIHKLQEHERLSQRGW